jgi:hypothetical protein
MLRKNLKQIDLLIQFMILGKERQREFFCFLKILFFSSSDTSRKWTKSTPPRTSTVSKTSVSDSGKPMEKLMCSYW